MDKENKTPRICEVLGVEIGEEWKVQGDPKDLLYRINEYGCREFFAFLAEEWHLSNHESQLFMLIENPSLIRHKPRWTEDDIADAKAARRLWPHAISVKRFKALVEICEIIYTTHDDGTYHKFVNYYDVSEDAFPSLKMGETVTLADILRGEADG